MARVYEKKPMGERLSKYLVDPVTGCWNWTGSLDRDGYGRMIGSDKGKRIFTFAHRASYEYHKGPIGPIDSNTGCVLHTCDNPSCINPDHLYLGDQAQNGLDKKLRGRVKVVLMFGADNPMFGKTGDKNPFYGRTHTEESKKKMSETKLANRVK